MKLSVFQITYILLSIAGLVFPWYFNYQFLIEQNMTFSPVVFIKGGFLNANTSSLTSDLLIGSSAVMIWMYAESRRLKMKNFYLFFASAFLISFAFACPLFLFFREFKIKPLE